MIGDETTHREGTKTGGGGRDYLATATSASDETEADHATDPTEIETETASGIDTETERKTDTSTGEREIANGVEAESDLQEVCLQ